MNETSSSGIAFGKPASGGAAPPSRGRCRLERRAFSPVAGTLLTACLAYPAPLLAEADCPEAVCIDLQFPLPTPNQIQVPPDDVEYILRLPEKPTDPVTVCILLFRLNANGDAELVNHRHMKLREIERLVEDDLVVVVPERKKRGDHVLMAGLSVEIDAPSLDGGQGVFDPRAAAREMKTRNFQIKWKEGPE